MQGRDLHPQNSGGRRGESTPSCYPGRTKPSPRERQCWATTLPRGVEVQPLSVGHSLFWEAPRDTSESPQLEFPPAPESHCYFPATHSSTHCAAAQTWAVIRDCLGQRQAGGLQLPHPLA